MKEAAIATFALGAALKVTVVFAAAALLLALLRRAPASFRHLAGSLTLAGALALPFLGLAVPSWELALLPAPAAAAEHAAIPYEAADESKFEAVDSSGAEEESSAAEPAAVEQFGYGVAVTTNAEPPPPPPVRVPWTPIALTIWGLGSAFLLARLGVGIVRMRRLIAQSEPASDEMVAAAHEAAQSLGIESHAAVLVSDETRVAITAGLRRPVLVLPREAAKWSPERMRLVLMHELAHVVRRDWAALIAVEVAVALYWFHPLAWALARQTRRDGERAADDLVLTAGTKPSVYAGHLLAIVRSLKADPAAEPLPAMGAVRPTQFEARLRAMLSGAVSHRALGAPQARLAAATLAAAIVTVAALSPWGKTADAAINGSEGSAVLASLDGDFSEASSESTETKSSCNGKSKSKEKQEAAGAATVSAELDTPEAEDVDAEAPPDLSDTPEPSFVYAIAPEAPSTPMPTGFVQASKRKHKSKGNDDHYDQGMSYHRDGDYDEAIAEFQRSIDENYKPAASAYNIACGYALKGDADSAFTWLKKSALLGFEVYPYAKNDDDFDGIHDDPRWRQLSKLAREWEQEGEKVRGQEAERRFADMLSNPSTSGEDLYDTGMELHRAGRYDAAAKAWQAAAAKGYRPGTSAYNVACAYSLAGDTDRALQFLRKGVEEGFDGVDSIARQDEDLDNIRTDPRFPAILQMAKALQLGPWGGKYKGKTVKWDWDGEEGWGESAKEYEAYANANPQLGRAWFNLGFAKLKIDDAKGAIAAFHKALDQNYRRGTTMYNLACSYARDKQKDQAFSWLNKAMDAGFNPHGMMRGDEDLDNLRHDPRYAEVQRRARNIEWSEKDED
jgi:beta-lactamase regulating signal transducer with metallopeptidase domain/tetratricopeptide (TPR) repeat protein